MCNLGQPILSFVSSCFDGSTTAYLYLWISKKWKVIYVGQTNERRGSFGRAYSHVQDKGTFRQRFEEEVGINLEEANDLVLVSYPLPQKAEYIGVESSYREAVEYLVQIKLREIRGNLEPRFNLISKVRYSDRASSLLVKQYAQQIVQHFEYNYPSI